MCYNYNGSNSYLFVNTTKIHQFKAKDSEITTLLLCLWNILENFADNNIKETGLNGYAYHFSVDYYGTDVGTIQNIHRYLMNKNALI